MPRLLWLAPQRTDPEEELPALFGRRPAPEPLTFSEISADLLRRRSIDIVLIDARDEPGEAAAVIRKLKPECDASFVVIHDSRSIQDFDWASRPSDFMMDGCSRSELEARLDLLSGSSEPDPSGLVRRGNISINRERFEVKVGSQVVDLTFKEFELLAYLADRPGRVCSRDALLREVWGYDFFGGTRTVDVHVRRLRAKLGAEAHAIETVRNVGYRFTAPR